jgi:hypothetical protein
MDIEETEDRNDCADKGQQQFNRPIATVSQGVQRSRLCDVVTVITGVRKPVRLS